MLAKPPASSAESNVVMYGVSSSTAAEKHESKQDRGPPLCIGMKQEHVLTNAMISTTPSDPRPYSSNTYGTPAYPYSKKRKSNIPTAISSHAFSTISYFSPFSLSELSA